MAGPEKPYLEIIEDVRLTVDQYRGKMRVDIREYYYNKEGDAKPTKKGLSFELNEWSDFVAQWDDILAFVNERLPKETTSKE